VVLNKTWHNLVVFLMAFRSDLSTTLRLNILPLILSELMNVTRGIRRSWANFSPNFKIK